MTVTPQNNTQDPWELKHKVVPQWGRKYFYRTKEWGRGLANSLKRQALEEQLQRQPPYIPPKFRQYHARNEAHYKIIEKKSLNNMQATRDEYQLNMEGAKQNFARVDQEVSEQISRHPDRAERDFLSTLWKQETEAGQIRSTQRTQRTWNWLADLPTEKPYYGYNSCKPEMRPQRQSENNSEQTNYNYNRQHNNVERSDVPVSNHENQVPHGRPARGPFRHNRGNQLYSNAGNRSYGRHGGGRRVQWPRHGGEGF